VLASPSALAGLLALGATVAAPHAASIPVPPGRTTTVPVTPALGVSVERAGPGRAFDLAVALDADERWPEAAAQYQQVVVEWSETLRLHPSPALERAVQKAEREHQRSLLLASTLPARGRFELSARFNPLEEGKLLRAKLMVVRAARGRAPPDLVARAVAAFEEVLRAAGPPRGADTEARLLLCATRAAAGDRAAARLESARVTTAERHDLDNALPLAVCAAALGDDDEAMARLEIYVLRPAPHPLDPYTLRDLYLANDWDRLRGQPRFESLFAAALPP
jgi:hypothetical protein